ncbi:2-oxo acid dehydrogenase subunit E2 [Terrilactibacillus sp. BCM23-1]|uniref:Dihydrolipoamide acetyltransferase component of pyruvate dehydrogenase complex n=1 Tax=Terrilactibacillus tamarindi TaxID=2599694 RepID=A0A6N8CVG7_9BACI|nr:dihydrolipoamide acetyltransferase family protein [Terrilactibacillus tamarindi]MTT33245.1 2-oxo acid dehydrogenase subunit E2 [Terrilactibacillus tamarindi]
MAVEIVMPKLGMGMSEGTVVEWLKNAGDPVKKGESVVVISSDKIEKDVEAPDDGILLKVNADPDDTVPVGEAIGYIGAENESIDDQLAKPEGARSETSAETTPNTVLEDQSEPNKNENTSGRPVLKLRVSPAARKLAKGSNIDVHEVIGTGPHGRITKADVLNVIEAKAKERNTPASIQQSMKDKEPTTQSEKRIAGDDRVKVTPISGMRKVISDRMLKSLQQSAQLTIQMTADVTELISFQKKAREMYQDEEDVRLTITDFVAKATILALKKHPKLNSTFDGTNISTYESVHLGIAVALNEGLVVPVIRDADTLSLSEVSKRIRKMSIDAREGKLAGPDMIGSTFTISSLGTSGVTFFTPVLNPPEIGILGIGSIYDQAVFVGETIEKRRFLPLSLTFDHRIIDGSPASNFLSSLKTYLETPFKIVL